MLVEAPDGSWVDWTTPEWRSRTDFDPTPADPTLFFAPYFPADRPPDLVLLGGLGDVDERTPAAARWPDARIIGVDMDPRAVAWQMANGWPPDDLKYRLIRAALDRKTGRILKYNPDTICCASAHPSMMAIATETATAPTVSIDDLASGATNALISLDLEGWEYWAIRGATRTLAGGWARVVGVEVRYEEMYQAQRVAWLLAEFGYQPARVWFRQWWGHNEIYVRR